MKYEDITLYRATETYSINKYGDTTRKLSIQRLFNQPSDKLIDCIDQSKRCRIAHWTQIRK